MPSRKAAQSKQPQSFSYSTKAQICREIPAMETAADELRGLTLSCASVHSASGAMSVRFTTENEALAKRIVYEVRHAVRMEAQLRCTRSSLKKRTFSVLIPRGREFLAALKLKAPLSASNVPEDLSEDAKAALLRGAFLGSGTVSDPSRGYHLEFVISSGSFAETLRVFLSDLGISASIIRRKDHFVLYLNEGDSIVAVLALIGAHTSILNFENVRVLKETRNNVNRALNCVTANIDKTVNAALQQIASIERIARTEGLVTLSPSLREAAELRLEYPEASLQELCEIGGITKSAMNHRLRKINAIARELSGEDGAS